jgi:hypothetical protein
VDADRAASQARAALGADLPLEPLRIADAATFRAPSGIVRVTSAAFRDEAEMAAEVDAVRRIRAAGAAVMAPLEGPIAVEDAIVVLWEDVEDVGARDQAAYAAMGRTLAQFHEVGGTLLRDGALAPPPWEPLSWLEGRLARGGDAVDPGFAAALRERAVAEADGLHGEETVLHTDAHEANFRVDRTGRAVLVDLEGLARGCWRYDLAPMAVGERRYGGDPERWRDAVRAYGIDPDDPELGPAIRLRELLAVAYAAGQAYRDPDAMRVARARFEDIQTGNDSVWVAR